jgi:putative peptide zinc metalloprotease protein
VKVGDAAPGFALPAAQGRTVDLATYKGRNVILWFTKGFGCPFCRQQMSQFARAAPRFLDREADVLQITPTPLERARLYARNFKLPFPYLCMWTTPRDRHTALVFVTTLCTGISESSHVS